MPSLKLTLFTYHRPHRAQDYRAEGTPLINTAYPGDKLVFQYSRLPVTGFRRNSTTQHHYSLPPPTPARLEAMDLLERLAWKHSLALPAHAGDVAYINNLTLMHARRGFDLDPLTGTPLPSKRHLVKMLLRDPELKWELPRCLDWYSRRVYGANREGGTRWERWDLVSGCGDGQAARQEQGGRGNGHGNGMHSYDSGSGSTGGGGGANPSGGGGSGSGGGTLSNG